MICFTLAVCCIVCLSILLYMVGKFTFKVFNHNHQTPNECQHQWLAKSFGKQDENTGKYLGRCCICMHCHKEALFIDPPNGVINW